MNLLRFLFSKWFFLNLLIAGLIVVLSFFLINRQLNKYTLHDQELVVPDLHGYSSDSLADMLKRGKFRMKIIDSLWDKNIEPGAVILQNPESGSLVKENRSIYLTINSHQPPLVKLPALIDQSLRQAEATIRILHLEIKEIIYRESPYNNLVLDVLYEGESVAEGGELPLNSSLQLVIGSNMDLPLVNMPDLLYLKPGEADSVLMDYKLNLGLMIDCIGCFNGEDSAAAVISRTNPQYKPEKQVRMGSSIDYWLSVEIPDSSQTKD